MPNENEIDIESLAERIARGFGEMDLLDMYRKVLARYPLDVIRRAYEETLEIPADRIHKSRGALFNFLLKKYARELKK